MAIYDNRDSQSGDHTSRDAAGRDITNIGIPPGLLLQHFTDERERWDRVWGRLDTMERDARQAERDAAMERGIDFEARLKRQFELDRQLAILRRWLAGLTVALVLAVVVIGWLAVDRFSALSVLHYWMGGAGALAYRLLTYGQR